MPIARSRMCSFELDPRGFVYARVDHGSEMTADDARENLALTREVMQGKPRPVLVDLRGIRSQTREARDVFSSQAVTGTLAAVALLVSSPVSTVVGNFFVRLRAQPVPTRLFRDEQAAVVADVLAPRVLGVIGFTLLAHGVVVPGGDRFANQGPVP